MTATVTRLAFAVAVSILAAPLIAETQQAARVYRVGFLDYGSSEHGRMEWWNAFRERMREFGYVEGQNVLFEPRWSNHSSDRLQTLANELVAMRSMSS